jgi:hypothetical protein
MHRRGYPIRPATARGQLLIHCDRLHTAPPIAIHAPTTADPESPIDDGLGFGYKKTQPVTAC